MARTRTLTSLRNFKSLLVSSSSPARSRSYNNCVMKGKIATLPDSVRLELKDTKKRKKDEHKLKKLNKAAKRGRDKDVSGPLCPPSARISLTVSEDSGCSPNTPDSPVRTNTPESDIFSTQKTKRLA